MSAALLRSRARRFGVVLVCAQVALVPTVFDRASDWSFTVPKALLSHAIAYALVAIVVGLLVHFRGELLVRSELHVPILLFLGTNAIATVVSVDPRLALFGAHARMLGLGTIADWVVLYLSFVLLVRTRGEVLTVLAWALAASAVVVFYEGVQIAHRDPFTWSIDTTGRPISTLGQATTLGSYLTIVASGVAACAVFLERLNRWQRGALLGWAGVLLLGAVESGTRSIILGAGAALLLVVFAATRRAASVRLRMMTAAVGVVAAATLGLLIAFTPLGARVGSTFLGDTSGSVEVDPSTAGRLDLYRIAAGIITERPLLGYGPDTFAVGVPKYRPEGASEVVRQSLATSAHGWIPYVATGSGTLGLLTFLAILAVAFRGLVRAAASPIAIAGAAMAGAFLGAGLTTIDDIAIDWLFWLGLALIAAAPSLAAASPPPIPQKRGSRRRQARTTPPRGPMWAVSAGVGIATLGLLVGIPAWSASRSAYTSESLRLNGKVREAIDAARLAVGRDGGRAEYWHALGFAYVAAQRYREAASAFDRAVQLAPYDVLHINDEVQAELALAASGDQAAKARALALSDQAVRTDANNPRAQLLRASTLAATGDYAAAEPFVRRALVLDPRSQNELLYVTAVNILRSNGKSEEAIAIARTGLTFLPATAVGLRLELARTLLVAGRPTEALAEVDTVLKTNPNLKDAQALRSSIVAAIH